MSARKFQVLVLINAISFLPVMIADLVFDLGLQLFVVGVLALQSIPFFFVHAVKRDLRVRGYDWLGFEDAAEYVKQLGTKTSNVPHRTEMQMIPGYKDGSVDSLCRCLEEGKGRAVADQESQ